MSQPLANMVVSDTIAAGLYEVIITYVDSSGFEVFEVTYLDIIDVCYSTGLTGVPLDGAFDMVGGPERYSIGIAETLDFSGILNGLCTYTMDVFID